MDEQTIKATMFKTVKGHIKHARNGIRDTRWWVAQSAQEVSGSHAIAGVDDPLLPAVRDLDDSITRLMNHLHTNQCIIDDIERAIADGLALCDHEEGDEEDA